MPINTKKKKKKKGAHLQIPLGKMVWLTVQPPGGSSEGTAVWQGLSLIPPRMTKPPTADVTDGHGFVNNDM